MIIFRAILYLFNPVHYSIGLTKNSKTPEKRIEKRRGDRVGNRKKPIYSHRSENGDYNYSWKEI